MSVKPRKATPTLGHWLTPAMEGSCRHRGGAGARAGREQLPRFSFSVLILSFFPSLWAPLSIYSIHLSLLSFFFSFPSPFLPQEDKRLVSAYTSLLLLSFSLHWPLPVLV